MLLRLVGLYISLLFSLLIIARLLIFFVELCRLLHLFPVLHLVSLLGERSSFSLPFNFIHFAVSASSDLFEQFKAGNPLSLLYVDTST